MDLAGVIGPQWHIVFDEMLPSLLKYNVGVLVSALFQSNTNFFIQFIGEGSRIQCYNCWLLG